MEYTFEALNRLKKATKQIDDVCRRVVRELKRERNTDKQIEDSRKNINDIKSVTWARISLLNRDIEYLMQNGTVFPKWLERQQRVSAGGSI